MPIPISARSPVFPTAVPDLRRPVSSQAHGDLDSSRLAKCRLVTSPSLVYLRSITTGTIVNTGGPDRGKRD